MNVFLEALVLLVSVVRHILYSLFQWIRKPSEKLVANEICLITGTASGLGRLLALEFAKRGATLVLWDINREGNAETAKQARQLGVDVYVYACDVSQREKVYETAEQVRREVGDVTILINNAEVVAGMPLLQCPDELLEKTLRTNCHAPFWSLSETGTEEEKAHLRQDADLNGHSKQSARSAGSNETPLSRQEPARRCPGLSGDQKEVEYVRRGDKASIQTVKAFLPKMIEMNHGHIVTIASYLGLIAAPGVEDYCASKFATVGFHESLSHQLKSKRMDGIKTTLVCPYNANRSMVSGLRIRRELETLVCSLKLEDYVNAAMSAILINQSMVCIPSVMYLAVFSKHVMPWEAQVLLHKFIRVDNGQPPCFQQRNAHHLRNDNSECVVSVQMVAVQSILLAEWHGVSQNRVKERSGQLRSRWDRADLRQSQKHKPREPYIAGGARNTPDGAKAQVRAHEKIGIWRAIAKEVRGLGVHHRRGTHCRKRWEDIRRGTKKTAESLLGMASQRRRGACRQLSPLMFRILAVAYPDLDGRVRAAQQTQGGE
ncbi:hypothetical protein NDU88_001655 [Pleurodeles waltl]|uniref:Myb/SANT-like DNA-binding domain-containing protein n=1 Tax=Pleurodeles waltl TaxID=8319 RepID=A0AAV7P7G3_PLEWA|nr:hypothetical protein NDU88_001655 [Pleurodeles waltl]